MSVTPVSGNSAGEAINVAVRVTAGPDNGLNLSYGDTDSAATGDMPLGSEFVMNVLPVGSYSNNDEGWEPASGEQQNGIGTPVFSKGPVNDAGQQSSQISGGQATTLTQEFGWAGTGTPPSLTGLQIQVQVQLADGSMGTATFPANAN